MTNADIDYEGIVTVGVAWLNPARMRRRWGNWLKLRREFVPHGWGIFGWHFTGERTYTLEELALIAGREGTLRV